MVSPFMDPNIRKILISDMKDYTANKLSSLYFTRFFDDLINIRVQSIGKNPFCRLIRDNELDNAMQINKTYPVSNLVVLKNDNDIDNPCEEYYLIDEKKHKEYLYNECVKSKDRFMELFDERYWNVAESDYQNKKIRSNNFFTPVYAICNILNKKGIE